MPVPRPSPAPVRTVLTAGAVTAAVAGAAAGAIDGLWAWGPASQFVPDGAGKLRLVAYLAAAYGLAALVIGVALTAVGVFLARATRLDAVWPPGAARDADADADARRARVAIVVAFVPLVAIALVVAHAGAVASLARRKHTGLVIVSAMASALGAVGAAGLLALALGRPVAAVLPGARRGPPRAPVPLAGLALVLVGLPAAGLALGAAYLGAVDQLTGRKPGAVIAWAMSAAVGALAAAALVTAVLHRPLARRLGALGDRRPALGRVLAGPRAPWRAAVAVTALGGAVVVVAAWATVRVLPWRGPAIVLIALALASGFAPAGRRLAARLARRHAGAVVGGGAVTAVALAVVMIVAGDRGGVIKAAVGYSGLGGPIAQTVRRAFDFDRDGYARYLGGGDCDDGDPAIHPGARDIPGDGVDQNCAGGDARLSRRTEDTAFVAPPATLPPDFNVVMITIDTLRADHLGMYGYARDTSPSLDALAAEATVFANAWAHAPSTRYSIPAILTGRLPLDVDYDFGVGGWPGLSPKATTIAEVLKDRGLRTGAILNYHYFDAHRRMNQGFDTYDNENKRLHQGSDPAHTRGSSSPQQTDKAIAWLDEHGADRFFLWVHYYDPHHEYERHDGVPSFGDEPVDVYDHEIRWTDGHIGRLFDDLRRRGLWDRTVIVVTGDHGEGFGEHGIDLHGYHLYAAQTKVPLIIRVPGQPGRVATTPAGHVDVLPTLANLAGVPASPPPPWLTRVMGRSLVDILGGQVPGDADRVVFQQLSYENNNEMRAAVSQRCHVIYNVSPHTSWEVYRIDLDPGETRDVEGAPGPCAEVRDELARWHDASQIPEDAAEAVTTERPAVARPIAVDFGDEVRLIGVDAPATAKAGDTIDVTWTFEARGRLDGGWKVFAHVEQPGGRGRFSGDHEPAWPLAWWRAGTFVHYTRSITIPRATPAGTYPVWAGLWKGKQRRPARATPTGGAAVEVGDDRAAVATIEVPR